MRHLLFIGCLLFMGAVSAQEISKNAIGLRFGGNHGFGSSVNYQRALSESNRLELDLGWRTSDRTDAYKLIGLYQWVKPLEGKFNWYLGAGGGIGSWSTNHRDLRNTSGSFVALAGNLGIEYNFDIPLLISLDFRPELYFGDFYRRSSFGPDIALSLRYQF